MVKTGFDWVAPYYDFLAWLVFGPTIRQAQMQYLNFIPAKSRILFIGGGTGWLLPNLISQVQPHHIVYLEASQKMLNLARLKTNKAQPRSLIEFRLGTERSIRADEKFDVIISHFFLDLFLPAQLKSITEILYNSLQPGGYWLVADFVNTPGFNLRRLWANILIKSMYAFFRLMSGISATSLPDCEKILAAANLVPQQSTFFYYRMIKSILYLKKEISS